MDVVTDGNKRFKQRAAAASKSRSEILNLHHAYFRRPRRHAEQKGLIFRRIKFVATESQRVFFIAQNFPLAAMVSRYN